MVNTVDRLSFSEPIELAKNQRCSVVVDDLIGNKGNPTIGNYGLVKKGETDDIPPITYFDLKLKQVPLSSDRDFNGLSSAEEASVALTIDCATKAQIITNFTVKSFPHYGVYGFVNYNLSDKSGIHYGLTLNKIRDGGEIF